MGIGQIEKTMRTCLLLFLTLLLVLLPGQRSLYADQSTFGMVYVRVKGGEDGKPLPCRLTIVEDSENLAALAVTPAPTLAYRPGVFYTATGVEASTGAPERLMKRLQPYDEAVAVQAAALCRERGLDLAKSPFPTAIDNAAPAVKQGFLAYQNLLVRSQPH